MTDLISRVKNAKEDFHGAFVKGVKNRMDAIKNDLERASPQMIATLYHVCADIEQHIALSLANERERDLIAHKQEKERKLSRAMKQSGNGASANDDHALRDPD